VIEAHRGASSPLSQAGRNWLAAFGPVREGTAELAPDSPVLGRAGDPATVRERISQETLVHPGVLFIALNLLRGGSRDSFLENVVNHHELRRRGHGNPLGLAALEHAWAADCHHVPTQSDRADLRVHSLKRGDIESGKRSLPASAAVPGVRTRVAPGCNLGQPAEVMGPAFRVAGALLDVGQAGVG